MNRRLLVIVLALLALPAAAQTAAPNGNAPNTVQQGSAQAAKDKIAMCAGCHGMPYYNTVFPQVYKVPMIAGQPPAYLAKALEAYKTGERNHPSMRAIARSLSAQDMADLAAYYGASGK